MQLGFVIDQSRCIGCHACTVACKSENDVPLGDFRTWVKYTERGEFPEVRRSFAVLRCNQCSEPPCVTICPVTALEKHATGIVDVDPALCIGCKSCMHACPYDALYINARTGTAEKCHFCAHRAALGLAPACAVVCPTEAIVPGDFDDPTSRVSEMKRELRLVARKPEAGTQPNVHYKDVSVANVDPGLANKAGGYLWADPQLGTQAAAQAFEEADRKMRGEEAQARTVYDVPRKELWGRKISGYLFFKSIAAGLLPVAWLVATVTGGAQPGARVAGASLAALLVTLALLVADLKRPERFLSILLRPNWDSWLTKGSYLILIYSALLALWLADALFGFGMRGVPLGAATALAGALTACYTAWLFAQAKGRVLWMRRHFWLHLLAQAGVAGAAALLLLEPAASAGGHPLDGTKGVLFVALAVHLAFTLREEKLAPAGREVEYARAARLLTHGPWMLHHWLGVVFGGTLLPLVLVLVGAPPQAAAALALAGLWLSEDLLVRAGQALPIS
ncbi:MAG: polysulfide reductase NrfD [Planctomycetes bacterium]|nr:polysulfide reductase NrfD [Planctomycetota bacterium]